MASLGGRQMGMLKLIKDPVGAASRLPTVEGDAVQVVQLCYQDAFIPLAHALHALKEQGDQRSEHHHGLCLL